MIDVMTLPSFYFVTFTEDLGVVNEMDNEMDGLATDPSVSVWSEFLHFAYYSVNYRTGVTT